MKKNITINICGQLCAIDEDACQLLEQYLDNMRRYFARREGGDEIADDIEHRVAEHIADLRAGGVEAVTLEHVQDIIRRIGNPEQMDDGEATPNADGQTASQNGVPPEPPRAPGLNLRGWLAARRLYRDPDDKMLSGLTAGLCKYFGGTDPLPWRIALVVLALLSFSTVGILYLIGWMLVPVASTDEDRLRMQGKPVTPETLSEEAVKRANEANRPAYVAQAQSGARGCLSFVLTAIAWLFKGIALFFVGLGLFVLCILAMVLGRITLYGIDSVFDGHAMNDRLPHLLAAEPDMMWLCWLVIITGMVCAGIMLYGLLRSILPIAGRRHLSVGTRVALIIVTLLCGATSLCFTGVILDRANVLDQQLQRQADTRGGYYLRQGDRNRLADSGWQILTYDRCNADGNLYEYVDALADDEDNDEYDYALKFDATDDHPMRVRLERQQSLAPGWYHLEAIASAREAGAYVYALPTDSQHVTVALPLNDMRDRGNLTNIAAQELRQTDFFAAPAELDSAWYSRITENGRSWNFVRSESFYFAGGPLRLGVANIPLTGNTSAATPGCRHFRLYDLRAVPDKQ